MCNSCGYSPRHCTCPKGFSPEAIRQVFTSTVRERAYVVAHSHPISTTKRVQVPAGVVFDRHQRSGDGWRLS